MAVATYTYLLVGGGLAGASACKGIREHDAEGSILLIGSEAHDPYNRPPLTKDLWTGKKQLDGIFANPKAYYAEQQVELKLDCEIVALDSQQKIVTDNRGAQYHYEKLLLATGGTPRHLEIPGAEMEGICYYRYLDDYLTIRPAAVQGTSAVVVGGGFIGSEIAAALAMQGVQVTMIFPEPYLVSRVFPAALGGALTAMYRQRGITILIGDAPTAFEKRGERFVTHTKQGQAVESDLLIVGVGITPNVQLAQMTRLAVANGIVVNELLQASDPAVYAAGDVAFFPYEVLGQQMRVEHWDNALNQGAYAGRNMAGAAVPYTYMPYFFSDLFDFGYEAVGDVNTKLETFADWEQENETGVIYYLKDGKLRGVMLCNVWNKVDAARELIQRGARVTPESLRGAIRSKKSEAA
ncbi:MAG TPA: FAD-dependent oxidoreductase [Armatimonadota bacterium]|jgi:NADPH-dependent 2,4-dienoyl-CoA reductase/sulfur reductase-like enzyme